MRNEVISLNYSLTIFCTAASAWTGSLGHNSTCITACTSGLILTCAAPRRIARTSIRVTSETGQDLDGFLSFAQLTCCQGNTATIAISRIRNARSHECHWPDQTVLKMTVDKHMEIKRGGALVVSFGFKSDLGMRLASVHVPRVRRRRGGGGASRACTLTTSCMSEILRFIASWKSNIFNRPVF